VLTWVITVLIIAHYVSVAETTPLDPHDMQGSYGNALQAMLNFCFISIPTGIRIGGEFWAQAVKI
jgi:hypothetical protein